MQPVRCSLHEIPLHIQSQNEERQEQDIRQPRAARRNNDQRHKRHSKQADHASILLDLGDGSMFTVFTCDAETLEVNCTLIQLQIHRSTDTRSAKKKATNRPGCMLLCNLAATQ